MALTGPTVANERRIAPSRLEYICAQLLKLFPGAWRSIVGVYVKTQLVDPFSRLGSLILRSVAISAITQN
ncbi:hypothetical protein X989_5093 [Burkholderia pseudomallei MSHR4378]|nr:hypothetical protein X989_5093 [Burkholderia pseudomallei MSHR4378]